MLAAACVDEMPIYRGAARQSIQNASTTMWCSVKRAIEPTKRICRQAIQQYQRINTEHHPYLRPTRDLLFGNSECTRIVVAVDGVNMFVRAVCCVYVCFICWLLSF